MASEIPRKILRTRVAATLRQVFSLLAELGIFGRIILFPSCHPVFEARGLQELEILGEWNFYV